ncbi:MAG: ABC transporter substrate-binding protein [Chloroflexota bacterium]|nr:ABC transporter substrate-binding protein [Chloroflexota bacterium]MDQ6905546.1 ABC transporter substrate-binding protein [Chloroflexota bacterium]
MSDNTLFGKRLNRRTLLGGIAGSAGAAILAACGSSKATDTPKPVGTTAPASGAATTAATTAPTKPAATTGTAATTAPAVATTAPSTSGSTTGSATTASGSAAAGTVDTSKLAAGQSVVAQKFANTAGQGSDVDKVDLKGKTVAVDFWHVQTKQNEDALKKIAADFNAANPGITVTPQYIGSYDVIAQKIQVGIQAKQVPAMAVGYENNVGNYQQADALLDLSPYINSKTYGWTKDDLSDIFPGFLDRNTYTDFKGQILSAPFTSSILMMWYNVDMLKTLGFNAPAKTWDEFKTQAAAAAKAGKRGYPVRAEASDVDGMVFSFGGEVITPDNKKAKFDSPQALATLQVLEDMAKAGTTFITDAPSNEDQTFFTNGDAPFFLGSSTGRAYIGAAMQKDPNDPTKGDKFDWNGTVIPQGADNLTNPKTALYGANAIIFKTTPEKQLASWLFLKYFTSKDVTAYWSIQSGYLPVRKSAAESDVFKTFVNGKPRNRAAFDIAQYGKGEPQPAGWTKARTDIQNAETQLLNKQLTAADAAKQLQSKINDDLANG